MMATHERNSMGGQTNQRYSIAPGRCNVTLDTSDGTGHVASRICWHFEECGYGCGDW